MPQNILLPIRQDDKARRPYVVCLDWLQVFGALTPYFWPDRVNPYGYEAKRIGHGSKYWRDLFDIHDENGEHIGVLCCNPHRKDVNQQSAMYKVDNHILYMPDAIQRVAEHIQKIGMKYVGITRADIAYDCNEYYNGLLPPSLIRGYLADTPKYVKCGQNRWMLFGDSGYHGNDDSGEFRAWNRDPRKKDDSKPLNFYTKIPSYQFGSITWGTRSQAVQVQIYDKSAELKVKDKPWIRQSWEEAGLDIERPVYRTEIRISNRGRQLVNVNTGEYFTLALADFLLQEQIEQLFRDYAEKYLKFYINDDHIKLQNKQRLRIFSLLDQPVTRQRCETFTKIYSRTAGIALHEIDKHIVENRREGNDDMSRILEQARQYFVDVYKARKSEDAFMAKDLALAKIDKGEYDDISPEAYFEARLKGAPHELAQRAAKEYRRIREANALVIEQLREDLIQHIDHGGSEAGFWYKVHTQPELFSRARDPRIKDAVGNTFELFGIEQRPSGNAALNKWYRDLLIMEGEIDPNTPQQEQKPQEQPQPQTSNTEQLEELLLPLPLDDDCPF